MKFIGPDLRAQGGMFPLIRKAQIRGSVVRREFVIEDDVEIEDSIIMDYTVVRRGARIRRAIIDQESAIEPGIRFG